MLKESRMMQRLLLILPVLLCLMLSACGGNQQTGLTPLPDRNDPKDEQLFEAIREFLAVREAPPNSGYDYVRVDLDGDGRREGLVLFQLPHTYWCGWDGCGLVVFRAHQDHFTPMSVINSVRGPIYVSSTGNAGWRDIIIRTSGTNMRDKNVVMQFNGRGYPTSPLLAPTLERPLSSKTESFFK